MIAENELSYQSLFPVPQEEAKNGKPDFHLLEYFSPIDLKEEIGYTQKELSPDDQVNTVLEALQGGNKNYRTKYRISFMF